MELERLIEMLSAELKLPALPQKDKNGCYQLKINPSITVSAKELDPGVFIHAQILPVPKEGNKEALFIHLMKANLLGQGTGGAAIGIDSSEKFFTLSQSLSFEVNYKTFHETLEDFLNYIDYWKEEVPKLQTSFL
jgi:hypothetical protein